MKGVENTTTDRQEDAKVFLSYSRKDRERASGLADALRARHFGVFKDTDDILPTEEWKTRLEELIAEADTIVFLLSPHSATSEVCAWEVEYATELNKRIAPIVIEDVEGDAIPPLLARLNFIFCTERDPFENAVDTLASALSTDIDWIREHTRLASLSRRWAGAGQAARLLLRGQDIADAEAWRDQRPKDAPEVTTDQAALIADSRRAASRRQRNWVFGSLAVALGAAALAVFAWFQSIEADTQRAIAQENASEARAQEARAIEQRDRALETQSLFLSDLAQQKAAQGEFSKGLALAFEGAPKAPDLSDRPLTGEILTALARNLDWLEINAVMQVESGDFGVVAVSPQANRVASGSWDGIVRLWDAQTGALIAALEGHEGSITALTFDTTGTRLASGSRDDTIRIWDVETSETRLRLTGHQDDIRAVAFSPNGSQIVSGARDKTARIWNIAEPDTPPHVLGGHRSWVTTLEVSPDGRKVVTGGKAGNVWLWDMENGAVLRELTSDAAQGSLETVAFSVDGQQVLAVSSALVVWDAETGKQVKDVQGFYYTDVYTSSFSPDRKTYVNVSKYDGIARLWDTETGAEINSLRGRVDANYEEFFAGSAFFADSKTIAIGSAGPRILIWKAVKPPRRLPEGGYDAPLSVLNLSPDTNVVLAGLTSGAANIWSANNNEKLLTLPTGADTITAITAYKDQIVTGSGSGLIKIFANKTGAQTASFDIQKGAINKIVPTSRGDQIGVVFSSGSARIINAVTGEIISTIRGHTAPILTLAFSSDGQRVLTGSGDFLVHVSEAETGAPIAKFGDHTAEVSAAAFIPHGTRAVSGDWRGFIRIWDTISGEEIALVRGHEGTVGKLLLSSDGKRLVSIGGDNFVRVWDLPSLTPIDALQYDDFIWDARLTTDGEALRVLHHDGSVSDVKVWADPAELIREAKRAVGFIQPLSIADRCDAYLEPGPICAAQ